MIPKSERKSTTVSQWSVSFQINHYHAIIESGNGSLSFENSNAGPPFTNGSITVTLPQ
jgi:hypothetical protein